MMSRVAPVVPAEADLLCEFCGYTLNGLPPGSNCPECGVPIAASLGQSRQPPQWERVPEIGNFRAFLHDSLAVIFTPTHFYKTITTRGDPRRAARFGLVHCALASLLFGIAGAIHARLFIGRAGVGIFNVTLGDLSLGDRTVDLLTSALAALILCISAFLILWGSILAASRLTAWEASYRGYRLPIGVVRRGLSYHAAHYFPVAILTLLTIVGYRIGLALGLFDIMTLTPYLYVLCAEVILFAAYLFQTYWIGMRNMMYANR
jgi:hypothetical protein